MALVLAVEALLLSPDREADLFVVAGLELGLCSWWLSGLVPRDSKQDDLCLELGLHPCLSSGGKDTGGFHHSRTRVPWGGQLSNQTWLCLSLWATWSLSSSAHAWGDSLILWEQRARPLQQLIQTLSYSFRQRVVGT